MLPQELVEIVGKLGLAIGMGGVLEEVVEAVDGMLDCVFDGVSDPAHEVRVIFRLVILVINANLFADFLVVLRVFVEDGEQ